MPKTSTICKSCSKPFGPEILKVNRKAYCTKCYSLKQKARYTPSPRVLKYSSDDERKLAARERAKKWYHCNKDRAKNRIHAWQKTEFGKSKRKSYRVKWKTESPTRYRLKTTRDRHVRDRRFKDSGVLELSSIVALESYNLREFSSTTNFHCEYCHSPIDHTYHLDHIVPISKGGKNYLDNLCISCKSCNLSKNAKLLLDWSKTYFDRMSNRKIL